MSYLDALLRKTLQIAGVSLTERKNWNIVSGATAVDNPITKASDITITGGILPINLTTDVSGRLPVANQALPAPQSIVWRPGVASAAGYVATWAEIAAFISASTQPAPVHVYCDTSLANCVVPAATNYDCGKVVYFISAAPNLFTATLEFENGAHLHRIAGGRDVYFTGAPTSVVPLTFDDQSVTFERCQFYASPGTAVPFVDIDGDCYVTINGGGAYYTEGTSFWDILAGASCIFRHFGGSGGDDPAMQSIAFSGDATTTLDFIHDDGVFLPVQTAFVGTFTPYRATVYTPLGTVATSDATPVFVTLATLATGEVRQIDAIASVAKADGSVRQSFRMSALVWNSAGTATLEDGSLTDGAPKGTGAAVVELALSSASVYLKVTGIAATDLVTTYDASVL